MTWLYESSVHDPYWNLAVEEYLLKKAENDVILYLWQNAHTVVIGKNQNPWKECRTTLLEQEGGVLARRLSGGGAVFHDLGNLNFTFLVPQNEYDLDRQFGVIAEAITSLGLHAERSGRNDMLAEGRKFSGNAFYKHDGQAYHHGTLLVDVDMSKLGQYLMPSKAKLQSKGVDSVRSRVVNLKELCPELTIQRMKEEMLRAFEQVYGMTSTELSETTFDMDYVNQLRERNASWDWNYGKSLPASFVCEDRFAWGGIQLQLQVKKGRVAEAVVYSDAMEWDIAHLLQQALQNCLFDQQALQQAVLACQLPENIRQDLCQLIETQNI